MASQVCLFLSVWHLSLLALWWRKRRPFPCFRFHPISKSLPVSLASRHICPQRLSSPLMQQSACVCPQYSIKRLVSAPRALMTVSTVHRLLMCTKYMQNLLRNGLSVLDWEHLLLKRFCLCFAVSYTHCMIMLLLLLIMSFFIFINYKKNRFIKGFNLFWNILVWKLWRFNLLDFFNNDFVCVCVCVCV